MKHIILKNLIFPGKIASPSYHKIKSEFLSGIGYKTVLSKSEIEAWI